MAQGPKTPAVSPGREQPTVSDLADVQLERVGGLEPLRLREARVLGLLFLAIDLVERRQKAHGGLGNVIRMRFGDRHRTSPSVSAATVETLSTQTRVFLRRLRS